MSSNFYNTEIANRDEEDLSESYKNWKRLRAAKYLVSLVLATTGLVILASQLGPLGISYVQGILLDQQAHSIKDPAPAQELHPDSRDLPYYDPGISYFQNLLAHFGDQAVAGASTTGIYPSNIRSVKIDKEYSSSMKLSIPRINIVSVSITPNVDSLNEKTYNQALKLGLAHFLGTPLPGDGGNSFIYGHSAVESWFSRHPDNPETIFSKLENIEIADTIEIEKDGTILTYAVQKKKITEPDDFDVIAGTFDKETVTLMTCWPLGIGSKRLIVIGERTDGQ